jgi:hypothetical protein
MQAVDLPQITRADAEAEPTNGRLFPPAKTGNSAVIHVAYQGVPVELHVTDKKIGHIEELINGVLAREGWAAHAAASSSLAPTNGAAAAGVAPVCQYHGPMKESTIPGKEGTYFCSKKMADGSYCKERSPK